MQKQSEIRVGRCELPGDTSDVFISHISASLMRAIESEEWRLGDRQFRDLTAIELFLHARTVEAVTLWLDFNKKPTIITDILRPKYTHLRALYLGDNNITSLEPLPALDAPLLERLFLNHNRIVSVKSLRKCTFPRLVELNLNGNLMTENNWLIEAHFPGLDKVSLGYKRSSQRIDEHAWFLKAEIKNQAQVLSPHHRLHTFNRITFFNNIRENASKRLQPKDLFKTFEN